MNSEQVREFMNLYLIRDSVTSFSLFIAAKSEAEAIWYWCDYVDEEDDNPIELKHIDINTPGIVWPWALNTNH